MFEPPLVPRGRSELQQDSQTVVHGENPWSGSSRTLSRIELWSRQIGGRWKRRRTTMLCSLLVGIGELDQQRLAPGSTDKGKANRLAKGETGGHRDRRVPGDRRGGGARTNKMIPVDQVGRPRRVAARRDKRVE